MDGFPSSSWNYILWRKRLKIVDLPNQPCVCKTKQNHMIVKERCELISVYGKEDRAKHAGAKIASRTSRVSSREKLARLNAYYPCQKGRPLSVLRSVICSSVSSMLYSVGVTIVRSKVGERLHTKKNYGPDDLCYWVLCRNAPRNRPKDNFCPIGSLTSENYSYYKNSS